MSDLLKQLHFFYIVSYTKLSKPLFIGLGYNINRGDIWHIRINYDDPIQ